MAKTIAIVIALKSPNTVAMPSIPPANEATLDANLTVEIWNENYQFGI